MVLKASAAMCILAATLSAAAAAAPSELMGKSVLVSWIESREQKTGAAMGFRHVTIDMQISIFVSTAGRAFTRMSAMGGRASGGAISEQVGGSGESLGGGSRAVSFEGQSILLQSDFGNYARHLKIDFDGAYRNCTAKLTVAKEVGAKTTAFRNSSGVIIEIRSLSPGATTCAVKSGNVFGQ